MSRKLRAMRDGRERRRLEGVEPRYPRELPALRRTVIIIDYDFGRVEHRIDLYRTPRIDCWRAVARRSSRQVPPRTRSLISGAGSP